MGFNPGGGGGSGSISTSSDVALSSVADTQVLAYDNSSSKWTNQSDADHQHAISQVTDLQTNLDAKAATSSLATVATSGSYTDLTDQPTIPTITASATEPSTPQTGDMWVDLSA